MTLTVFDASAVIAYLKQEPGIDLIGEHLEGAVISSVNLQEVARFLFSTGMDASAIRTLVDELELDVRPHTHEDALLAAELSLATSKYGSGLGDRSCMALAIRLGVPALTTDRVWANLDVPGLTVILAR